MATNFVFYQPYGGYFSCGVNFHYFRDSFGSHKFQPMEINAYTTLIGTEGRLMVKTLRWHGQ